MKVRELLWELFKLCLCGKGNRVCVLKPYSNFVRIDGAVYCLDTDDVLIW